MQEMNTMTQWSGFELIKNSFENYKNAIVHEDDVLTAPEPIHVIVEQQRNNNYNIATRENKLAQLKVHTAVAIVRLLLLYCCCYNLVKGVSISSIAINASYSSSHFLSFIFLTHTHKHTHKHKNKHKHEHKHKHTHS